MHEFVVITSALSYQNELNTQNVTYFKMRVQRWVGTGRLMMENKVSIATPLLVTSALFQLYVGSWCIGQRHRFWSDKSWVRFLARSNRTELPTDRHRRDVSSELCCPGAKQRRWAPLLVTLFGVIPRV